MGTAKVIQFNRVAPVYEALRLRAQVDKVPTDRFHQACAKAMRLIDEGRSNAMAITEGVKAMRPLRTVRLGPQGGAA